MDRFAIVDTYYWWLADHHEGQGSRNYARLSKVSRYYRPSPTAHGPQDWDAYYSLCERAGCSLPHDS